MRNFLIIVLLAAIAMLSFILVKDIEKDLNITEAIKPTRAISVGYNVTTHYFEANNQLKHLIVSEVVKDYSNRAGTHFQEPDIETYDNKRLSWTATAKKGFLSSDKNDITLTDDVLFVDDPKGEKPLFINGSVMYYHAPTNRISSNQSSIINDGTMRQVSEHFSLNTVSKIIDFSESIYGSYQTATD